MKKFLMVFLCVAMFFNVVSITAYAAEKLEYEEGVTKYDEYLNEYGLLSDRNNAAFRFYSQSTFYEDQACLQTISRVSYIGNSLVYGNVTHGVTVIAEELLNGKIIQYIGLAYAEREGYSKVASNDYNQEYFIVDNISYAKYQCITVHNFLQSSIFDDDGAVSGRECIIVFE